MSREKFFSGSDADNIRSDCMIAIERSGHNENSIFIKSKVDSLYGDSIRDLIMDELNFFGITGCIVEIDDRGALPFVISARLESVIKKMNPDEKGEFLPPFTSKVAGTSKDRSRRSRLYLPGDQPKLFLNAGIHKPDGIILDLEDSVSPDVKDDARLIVRNALRCVDFLGAERMVRINQLPFGLKDLETILPHKVEMILVPKVETTKQVEEVDAQISEYLKRNPGSAEVFLMPIIESALGIMNVFAISKASERIAAIAIGLEDYTADIGTSRTKKGTESFFARSMIVNAAKASGIQAIDTVYSDVSDMEGLRNSVIESKILGFDGKGCIHPRQVRVVHEAFLPSGVEIEKALKIVKAFEKAQKEGKGVVALGNKMIDPPVVRRALRTVDEAGKAGLIEKMPRE